MEVPREVQAVQNSARRTTGGLGLSMRFDMLRFRMNMGKPTLLALPALTQAACGKESKVASMRQGQIKKSKVAAVLRACKNTRGC